MHNHAQTRMIAQYLVTLAATTNDSQGFTVPLTAQGKLLFDPARYQYCDGYWPNFLFASALIGVKKLIKLPSGSRNKSERFPQGIVVGA
jgi:hypothetical protein